MATTSQLFLRIFALIVTPTALAIFAFLRLGSCLFFFSVSWHSFQSSCVQQLRALVLCWLRGIRQHIIFVKVIAFKEFLYTIASELRFAFFNCLCILPLLIIHMICVEIVHIDIRHILTLHFT